MATIHNTHERDIDAPAGVVGSLLDRLGRDEDVLWPAPAWPPMRLDRPVAMGADGGHGPIRYRVTEHEPGVRVRFAFHHDAGPDGYHEFLVEPLGPERCRLRHVVVGTPRGRMRVLWPVAVRWLHDAVIEDLLDNAERVVTGPVARPARWSPWVRTLRIVTSPRPRAVPLPERARLARTALDRTDLADAWQVPLARGVTTDPQAWADAVFRSPPLWVAALLGLRNALVGLVGIERGDRSAFDTIDLAATEDPAGGGEVLLGTDAGHLDFRASVLVDTDRRVVTLTTVVRVHNRRGRLYMAIVRRAHPPVVRAMLRRALRQLAVVAPGPDHGLAGKARPAM